VKMSIIRLGSTLLLSALLIGVGRPATGASVQIRFSGKGTGANTGQKFWGSFTYNPGYASSGGYFDLHNTIPRAFSYGIDTGLVGSASGIQIDTYMIKTYEDSYRKFHVLAHRVGVPGLTFEVVISPTVVPLSDTNLPKCNTVSPPEIVFPANPVLGTSPFTLSGSTSFTGYIDTVLDCSVAVVECPPVCLQPCRSGCLSRMKAWAMLRRCRRR
jgi:hypothetical protein